MARSTHRMHRQRPSSQHHVKPVVLLWLAFLMILGSFSFAGQSVTASPPSSQGGDDVGMLAQSGQMPPTSMTGPGTYELVATREGLVGGMTSSGHIIAPNDHFVALPACTATNCPWQTPGVRHERWGLRTECGDQCYVKVTNEDTGSCEVAPILDTGPWFTHDDWWRPAAERHLNLLPENQYTLPQGVTGASAARNGLDVGHGIGPSGYGASNRDASVGNAAAIDLADGTWMALGLDFNKGIDVVDVQLLWQTGGNPASEAANCGHPLNQSGDPAPSPDVPAGSNPSFSGSKLDIVGSSSTRTTNASTRAHDGSLETSWHTTGGIPSETSITVDLGRSKPVSGVKWTFAQEGGADSLTVASSSDGIGWSTIGTSGNRQAGTWEGLGIDRSARYVRLIFTNPNGVETIGYVAELEVWGSNEGGDSPPTPIESTPYPGSNPSFAGDILPISSASSSALPSGQQTTSATRATDGSMTTNWATTGGTPDRAILTVDLGSVHSVSGVKWAYNRSDGVDRQILQVSVDGTNWTQKVITSWRQPFQWEGFAVNQDARYVRFILTNDTERPVLGYIAEVQVWGSERSVTTPTPSPTPGTTPDPALTDEIVRVLIEVLVRVLEENPSATAAMSASSAPYAGSDPSFSGEELAVSSASASALPSGQQTNDPFRTIDDTTDTSWFTTGGDPERAVLNLDLGSVHSVSGVKWVYDQSDGIDQQILEVSSDGVTWNQMVITSARQPLQWEGVAIDEDIRYIRFTLTNEADLPVLGYIAEIQVWGETATTSTMAASSLSRQASLESEGAVEDAPQPAATPAFDADVETETSVAEGTPTAEASGTEEVSPTPSPTAEGTPTSDASPTEATSATLTPTVEGTPATETVAIEGTATMEVSTVEVTPATEAAATEELLTTETPVVEATPTSGEELVDEASVTETAILEETETPTIEVPATEAAEIVQESWTGYVAGTGGPALNCRAEPNAESPTVGQLEPGSAVTVTGAAQEGWLSVDCLGSAAWVSADFISDIPPPTETEAAVVATERPESGDDEFLEEPASSETEVVAEEETEPTPEEVTTTREVALPVSADLSVSGGASDGAEDPGGSGLLSAGGSEQHLAALTFDVSGIGDGTITGATLTVTGASEGSGGNISVVSGYSVDPWSTTWSGLQASDVAPAAWLDWISAGSTASVDVTGWIPPSGPVTFLISGTSDQPVGISSQESGAGAVLVLTIEE